MTPDEVPAELVQKAKAVLDVHRWKSMGVSSVECECGEILHGDASLTTFPADAAFLEHVTRHALAAVLPTAQEQAWDAGANVAAGTAVILGRAPKDLPERVRGHNPHRAAEAEGKS